MEWDGKIQAATLRCSVTGEAIAPGEVFWSGLLSDPAGGFRRVDFSAKAWNTADREPFISWWRQQAPPAEPERRQVRLDATVLRRLFQDLREIPRRPEQCLCYVVALCLVRARAFTLHARPKGDEAELVLEDRHDRSRWRLADPRLSDSDIAAVQQVLTTIVAVGGEIPAGPSPA